MKKLIIVISLLLLSVSSVSANPWTMDGNKVYMEDSKAYLSAEPHTVHESGWVYFDIKSKVYSGNVDLAYGFDIENVKPSKAEYLNGGGNWVSIANKFDSIYWTHDNLTKWYYATNLPVVAGNTYHLRIWIDIPISTHKISGKYGFAIKPSSETLQEAKDSGHLYYLDPWFNSSWQYRKSVIVSTNGTSVPVWYQVKLNVTYNSTMQLDFDDIRFTNKSNSTLSYWIESKVNSSYANIWVNLSDAITNPGSDYIWMYYGNTEVSNGDNGTDTFPFFDDFNTGIVPDTSKWNNPSANNYAVTGGNLVVTGVGLYNPTIYAKTNFGYDYAMEIRLKYVNTATESSSFGFSDINTGRMDYGIPANTTIIMHHEGLQFARKCYTTSCSDSADLWTQDTNFNNFSIRRTSTSLNFIKNGVSGWNPTTSLPTGAMHPYIQSFEADSSELVDYVYVRKYVANEPTYIIGAEESASWTNNWTSDSSLSFQIPTLQTVKFNFTVSTESSYQWTVNGAIQSSSSNIMNYTFATTGTYYINVSALTMNLSKNWTVSATSYSLEAITPLNGSTGVSSSSVTFTWREWITDLPHILYVATDNQFINIVSTSVISLGTYENFTTNVSGLSDNTQYFWKVKNNSGYYTNVMNFTTTTTTPTPGGFNITVLDGSNLSIIIKNYTLNIYNSTSIVSKNSNTTTGWCNLSSSEIGSGEYLIVVDPTGIFNNYYQRMVLADSPGNVTMYVPNSSAYTIDSVSFSLLDVTGLFPFQTSVITVSRGGLVRDKSYFGMDGTHIVHLTHGKNYQITIQNGNNVQVFNNYVAYATGTSQITINNFSVNYTYLDPFRYNITHTPTAITLHWSDVGGVMSSLNFTVRNQTSHTQICSLITSVKNGQTICSINNQSAFFVIFSASLSDNTFQNTSFLIDYTTGTRKTSTGVNSYDGSPMGTGFVWNYGTWETPDWVYNGICIILFILLAGTFGGYFSGFGGIILGVFALIIESVGWFRPLGTSDASQLVVMGITGGLTFLAVIYYLQHRDKGG